PNATSPTPRVRLVPPTYRRRRLAPGNPGPSARRASHLATRDGSWCLVARHHAQHLLHRTHSFKTARLSGTVSASTPAPSGRGRDRVTSHPPRFDESLRVFAAKAALGTNIGRTGRRYLP